MINGVAASTGTEMDPSAQPRAPRSTERGFSRALDHASATDAGRAAAPRPESSRDDSRARTSYGHATGRPSREKTADNAETDAPQQEKSAPQASEVRREVGEPAEQTQDAAAQGRVVTPAQMVQASREAALQRNEQLQGQQSGGQTRPGIQVALGMAAYRLGPHSQQEAQAAAKAGIELVQAGAQQGGEATEANGKAAAVLKEVGAHGGAQGAVKQGDEALQGALARLQQIRHAATTGEVTGQQPGTELPQGAQARQQLINQLSGATAGEGQQTDAAMLHQKPPQSLLDAAGRGLQGKRAEVLQHATSGEGATTGGLGVQHSATGTPDTSGLAQANQSGRVPQQQLVDAMVQEARWSLNHNGRQVTIKLHPEHLGDVRMKVTHRDGTLKLDMTVENHAVKSLIESRMGDLRARLQSEQFTSGSEFQFNVDVRQGNDSHQSAGQLAGDGAQAPLMGGVDGVQAEQPPSGAARAQPRWGTAGVGIYA